MGSNIALVGPVINEKLHPTASALRYEAILQLGNGVGSRLGTEPSMHHPNTGYSALEIFVQYRRVQITAIHINILP